MLQVERLRVDAQDELELISCRLEETSGQLSAQMHMNTQKKQELGRLQREMEVRNQDHELQINELCNLQWTTLGLFRELSIKATSLDNDVSHVLSQFLKPS